MLAQEANLIKVLTLSPKYAKQIRILTSYNTGREDLSHLQEIREKLRSGELSPIGWVMGGNLGERCPSGVMFWLVQTDRGLFFTIAPDQGSETRDRHKDVPQLFV